MNTEQTPTTTPVFIPDLGVVKASFNKDLIQKGLQAITTEKDKLIYNEDNISNIIETRDKIKMLLKEVDKIHKKGKEPFLEGGRVWDAAKSDISKILNGHIDDINAKYIPLAKKIEEQHRKQEEEKKRIQSIKDGISQNTLMFASKLAAAVSLDDIISIERLINLEKGKPAKYQEFNQDAINSFNTLTDNIKQAKERIKSLEAANNEILEAEKSGDDLAIYEATKKQEEAQSNFIDAINTIQEEAVSAQVATASISAPLTEAILPSIKTTRKTWSYEVTDINLLAKKHPEYVKLVIDKDKLDTFLKEKKSSFEGEEETKALSGVKFFLNKTY